MSAEPEVCELQLFKCLGPLLSESLEIACPCFVSSFLSCSCSSPSALSALASMGHRRHIRDLTAGGQGSREQVFLSFSCFGEWVWLSEDKTQLWGLVLAGAMIENFEEKGR